MWRALYAVRELLAGTILNEDDLLPIRPASRFSPADMSQLVGRRLKRDVATFASIDDQDLE